MPSLLSPMIVPLLMMVEPIARPLGAFVSGSENIPVVIPKPAPVMLPLLVIAAGPPVTRMPASAIRPVTAVPSPRIVPALSRLSCEPVDKIPVFAP